MEVVASSHCLSPCPVQPRSKPGLGAALDSVFFPSQVPDRPGVLDPGRADHVQGVRDGLGGLASAAGEIADPPQRCVSGWTFTAKARRLPLGAIVPSWFGLPGVSGQAQAHEKAVPGSHGRGCQGHGRGGECHLLF